MRPSERLSIAGLPPLRARVATAGAFPLSTATWSGVSPVLFRAFGSAPFAMIHAIRRCLERKFGEVALGLGPFVEGAFFLTLAILKV